MVPNGTAYSNFPPFATNGTKTPPGGSPESAKYALGMVPADTFPAEWANYLFHGATAGITRLNQDTGSIKKEINSVLLNFNITPDATLNNQLLAALNKLKAEAALAAHPVGSLYWTSLNENPATTFGGGTWVQIKDRFILAAGDTYSQGTTGGSATVTLTAQQIPSHTHSFTPQGNVESHKHKVPAHSHGLNSHTHTLSGEIKTKETIFKNSTSTPKNMAGTISCNFVNQTTTRNTSNPNLFNFSYVTNNYVGTSSQTGTLVTELQLDANHEHLLDLTGNTSGPSTTNTADSDILDTTYTEPAFTGIAGTTDGGTGGGQAHENMPPYIVKYCWERTA